MKYLIIVLALFSPSVIGCIPCDEEAIVDVYRKALPKFPPSYQSSLDEGEVTVKVDINSKGFVERVEILKLVPADLPKDVILEMIRNSKYEVKAYVKDKFNCGVEDYELSLSFSIPQKLKFDLDLKL